MFGFQLCTNFEIKSMVYEIHFPKGRVSILLQNSFCYKPPFVTFIQTCTSPLRLANCKPSTFILSNTLLCHVYIFTRIKSDIINWYKVVLV